MIVVYEKRNHAPIIRVPGIAKDKFLVAAPRGVDVCVEMYRESLKRKRLNDH